MQCLNQHYEDLGLFLSRRLDKSAVCRAGARVSGARHGEHLVTRRQGDGPGAAGGVLQKLYLWQSAHKRVLLARLSEVSWPLIGLYMIT